MTIKTKLFTLLALSTLLPALPMASAISIKHERGTLDIKAPAKRVVALEYSFIDTLLALGVKPVGSSLGHEGGDRGAPPYLLPKTVGLTSIGSRAQPSFEKIAASKPDLILADAFVHKDLYPQLSALAPTAMLQSRRGSLDDLNAQTLAIGQLVGREAAARRLLDEQKGLVQKARIFTNPKAPAFVTAVVTNKTFTIHTNESFVGSFLEELGRKNAVKMRGTDTQYEISLEGLVALQPQTLVLFTDPGEKPITDEWRKNPLWQKLPAVRRGRVYQFNRDNWTRGRGPMGLKLMVAEAIDSRLLQDGAPAGAYKY